MSQPATPSAQTRSSARKMRREFYALHALTLDPATTTAQLTAGLTACEAVTERHRLSEGAVYASACRRYLLETGRSWRTETLTAATTTWGGVSSHRYRWRDGVAACSCGASSTTTQAQGPAWHDAHTGLPTA